MKESCFKGGFCSKQQFIKKCHSQLCRAQHLGMTANWKTAHGFTLIEILVVVLIIAILAAVAVPQYQKAVKKSRATQVDLIINTATKAVDAYLLENGLPQGVVYFTGKNAISTIDMPGDCSKDNYCYTDVGRVSLTCFSSTCVLEIVFSYHADGTSDPLNSWLSSQNTTLGLRKASPGGKWTITSLAKINKNSTTDAEQKKAGEVICPIVEKYVEPIPSNCR